MKTTSKTNETTANKKKVLTVDEAVQKQQLDMQVKGMENAHAVELKRMAAEIISLTAKTGVKYLELCTYIREKEVSPKLATFELCQAGLHKARVSEVVTVAHASEANWAEFVARSIGFKKVLDLERGNVQTLIAAETGQSVTDVKAEIEESMDVIPQAAVTDPALVAAESEAALQRQREARDRKFEVSAATILAHARAHNIGKKTWTDGIWTVKLERAPDYKVKLKAEELAKEKAAQLKKEQKNAETASAKLSETAPEKPAVETTAA